MEFEKSEPAAAAGTVSLRASAAAEMRATTAAGGAAAIPESLFDSVRPMPASIAAEMGETPFRSLHYQALFAIGIVLFCLTLAFNLIADYVSHKFKQVGSGTL